MTVLADHIVDWGDRQLSRSHQTPLLMISGAQGIGKSTALAGLNQGPRFRSAVIGIDDVYLPRAERLDLSRSVHPLCDTRGPPGTHDLKLLEETIGALAATSETSLTRIPVFDKRRDDRKPLNEWRRFDGKADVIILEGWLVGALPDLQAPKSDPVNKLEAERDSDGAWRQWQEDNLANSYLPFWRRADAFLHLAAPGFDVVLDWRLQQEETTLGVQSGALPKERRDWVFNFIQYFERITRRMLEGRRIDGESIAIDAKRNVI